LHCINECSFVIVVYLLPDNACRQVCNCGLHDVVISAKGFVIDSSGLLRDSI
jgi:hypothetical protein